VEDGCRATDFHPIATFEFLVRDTPSLAEEWALPQQQMGPINPA
jgi:hypothetical protein